ncbi:Uncharacterised protein [Achromobacter sp. 2789STDY5608633]|nr:Uncharacterised protein [Achromobacter sp. 2789STDY5608633]CUK23759.1 Uncharacterised protein [Achromobacter sp. 2789STDY5608615]
MPRTTGWMASGLSRHSASTAAKRSATHGPWYSSAASSAYGAKSMAWTSAPPALSACTAASNAAAAWASPKNSSRSGTASRGVAGQGAAAPAGCARE